MMNEIEQKIFTHWLKKKISEFVITQQDSYENEEIILCDVLNTLKGVELEDVVE